MCCGASAPRTAARTPAESPVRMTSVGCIGVQTVSWLARPERNDAPNRVIRRDADRDAIARNHLDAEAAHATAELGQHFVAGVALHAVKSAAVDGYNRPLHVNQIVLAQMLAFPFFQ